MQVTRQLRKIMSAKGLGNVLNPSGVLYFCAHQLWALGIQILRVDQNEHFLHFPTLNT